MSIAFNKQIVRRYFEEALDEGKVGLIEELFAEDCVIYRPESLKPILGLNGIRSIVLGVTERFSLFESRIHDIIAEGDRVVCRLSHFGTYKTRWTSRIGEHSVEGMKVQWDAIAIFRLKESKISEEWV